VNKESLIITTYTPEEIAKIYKVSKATVYAWIKKGTMKAKKIGERQYRIPQSEVAWITNGLDEDILKMEQEDLRFLQTEQVNDLLRKIRKKKV
jgi:excisionase family DNA binding protein